MHTSEIMSKNQAEQVLKAIRAISITGEQAAKALSSPEFIKALKEADKYSQIWFQENRHTLPFTRRRFLELHYKIGPLSFLEKLEKKTVGFLV